LHCWHTTLLRALLLLAVALSGTRFVAAPAAASAPAVAPASGPWPGPSSAILLPQPDGVRALLGGLALADRPGGLGDSASVLRQESADQATLETRQPEVQWSPAGATGWQTVPTRQDVQAGDRVRTGPGASARIVYFEGTVTEIGPESGIIVQRLERSPQGNIVGSLYQAVGTTVSRVVHLVDPAASFEVETPAATAFVRGTTPRVIVGADGATQVDNVPDETGGTVRVQGKDPDASVVILAPGQGTHVTPGQPPLPPAAISLGLGGESAQAGGPVAGEAQLERQQQRQQQQAQARQAVAQAQAGLASAAAELDRLTLQENQLLQTIALLLTPSPTVGRIPPLLTPTPVPRTLAPSPTPIPAIATPSPTLVPTIATPSPTLLPTRAVPSPTATVTVTATATVPVPGTCGNGTPPPGQVGPPPTTHGIFTTTIGAAPNRTFVVEWRVAHFADSANTANFELQLEEGTNRIYFVYNASVDAGASATAGIQQGIGTTAIQVSCDEPVLTNGRAIQFAPGSPAVPIPPGTPAGCPGVDAFGYACSNVTRAFVAGTTDIGNHCDDCVTSGVSLPFPFLFYGLPFNQLNVSSNGNVQFASTNAAFSETALPNASFNQAIFVMWADWVTTGFSDALIPQTASDCQRLQSAKCAVPLPPPSGPAAPAR